MQSFNHIDRVKGELKLPGDKSISHRAVMFASMAEGESIISNCSNSEDVRSTLNCFSSIGIDFYKEKEILRINGKGFKGFTKPSKHLYAGNSGTTARLMSGILAAQDFSSVITGDESLSRRPMGRVIDPLIEMGARISSSPEGTLPLVIDPSVNLHSINYRMKVASAQVKSSIILAALHNVEETVLIESEFSRNHTETMLGLPVEYKDGQNKINVSKKYYPESFQMTVPSDISTASFFIVLALLLEGSEMLIKNVSLNPTRTGLLKILRDMGGKISIENEISENGEISGDLFIRSGKLSNIEIPTDIIPNIIDEIPVLSVAGLLAEGKFRIKNAKELRVKESDRIKSLCHNFNLLGLDVKESDDGFELAGGIRNAEGILFESFGDHRIAMAFSVLSLILKTGGSVNGFESVAVSNPDFLNQLRSIC